MGTGRQGSMLQPLGRLLATVFSHDLLNDSVKQYDCFSISLLVPWDPGLQNSDSQWLPMSWNVLGMAIRSGWLYSEEESVYRWAMFSASMAQKDPASLSIKFISLSRLKRWRQNAGLIAENYISDLFVPIHVLSQLVDPQAARTGIAGSGRQDSSQGICKVTSYFSTCVISITCSLSGFTLSQRRLALPNAVAAMNQGCGAHGKAPLPGREVLSPLSKSIFPEIFFEAPLF